MWLVFLGYEWVVHRELEGDGWGCARVCKQVCERASVWQG